MFAAGGGPDIEVHVGLIDGRAGVEGVDELAGLLLHKHRAPGGSGRGGIDPGLEGHTGREVQRGGRRDGHEVGAVEGDRATEPPVAGPRDAAAERAGVVVAGGVAYDGAGALAERVCRDEPLGLGTRQARAIRHGHRNGATYGPGQHGASLRLRHHSLRCDAPWARGYLCGL